MPRLSKNVVLRHPTTGEIVSLAVGSEAPGWAELDEHVLEPDEQVYVVGEPGPEVLTVPEGGEVKPSRSRRPKDD